MINFYHNFGNNNLSFYKGYQLFLKVSHDFPVKITSKEVIKIGDLVLELIPLQEGLLNVVNVSNKNAKVVFHPDKKIVTIDEEGNAIYALKRKKIYRRSKRH